MVTLQYNNVYKCLDSDGVMIISELLFKSISANNTVFTNPVLYFLDNVLYVYELYEYFSIICIKCDLEVMKLYTVCLLNCK